MFGVLWCYRCTPLYLQYCTIIWAPFTSYNYCSRLNCLEIVILLIWWVLIPLHCWRKPAGSAGWEARLDRNKKEVKKGHLGFTWHKSSDICVNSKQDSQFESIVITFPPDSKHLSHPPTSQETITLLYPSQAPKVSRMAYAYNVLGNQEKAILTKMEVILISDNWEGHENFISSLSTWRQCYLGIPSDSPGSIKRWIQKLPLNSIYILN